ncbi:MAG: hypothetical protein JWN13_3638 [Betaproteobacteria bacterium]|jgi:hypothetical protein|nr:hypothetical protein [Betaproteobacteria bacterium]
MRGFCLGGSRLTRTQKKRPEGRLFLAARRRLPAVTVPSVIALPSIIAVVPAITVYDPWAVVGRRRPVIHRSGRKVNRRRGCVGGRRIVYGRWTRCVVDRRRNSKGDPDVDVCASRCSSAEDYEARTNQQGSYTFAHVCLLHFFRTPHRRLLSSPHAYDGPVARKNLF